VYPFTAWLALAAAIVALLAVDLLIVGRRGGEMSLRFAALASVVWVGVALLFGGVGTGAQHGHHAREREGHRHPDHACHRGEAQRHLTAAAAHHEQVDGQQDDDAGGEGEPDGE